MMLETFTEGSIDGNGSMHMDGLKSESLLQIVNIFGEKSNSNWAGRGESMGIRTILKVS